MWIHFTVEREENGAASKVRCRSFKVVEVRKFFALLFIPLLLSPQQEEDEGCEKCVLYSSISSLEDKKREA
jgi:hypothetical protein